LESISATETINGAEQKGGYEKVRQKTRDLDRMKGSKMHYEAVIDDFRALKFKHGHITPTRIVEYTKESVTVAEKTKIFKANDFKRQFFCNEVDICQNRLKLSIHSSLMLMDIVRLLS
jgi:hypothetical protein